LRRSLYASVELLFVSRTFQRRRNDLRALSKTFFGLIVTASLARFAAIPSIVPKLTTSRGPLTPISE